MKKREILAFICLGISAGTIFPNKDLSEVWIL